VLPAGTQPIRATAVDSEDAAVRSILDRYLGPKNPGASTLSYRGSDDNMSVSGAAPPSMKRTRDKESISDSDVETRPMRSRKVLRSRVIGSDSEVEPIVLSDSPKEVASKVRDKKTRARKLDRLS